MKEKFRSHTGTPVEYQRLLLKSDGAVLCEMSDNSKMLGFYSPISGQEIHIVDMDPFSLSKNGGLTDVSLVEKFKISDEAYEKRKGTMREYIREQRKKDPNFRLTPAAAPTTGPTEIPGEETVSGIKVGDRCEISPGGRRGVVRWIGEIAPKGYWVRIFFVFDIKKIFLVSVWFCVHRLGYNLTNLSGITMAV